jgi:ubiquitin-conjugating enzyme E2 variant
VRSRAQVRVDRLGFYVYNGVQVAVLVRTWGKLPLWELAALVLAGYVLADLFTGLLHWFFDTWGSPETPVLGQVIAPFRQHHQTPLDIVRHDFLETVGNSCWAILPLLLPALWLPAAWAQLLSWTAVFAVQANLVHRAAHRLKLWLPARMPAGAHLYVLLAQLGIVQSPEDHDEHHRAPYKQNWCILSGWWNPLLNRVLPRLERALLTLARH